MSYSSFHVTTHTSCEGVGKNTVTQHDNLCILTYHAFACDRTENDKPEQTSKADKILFIVSSNIVLILAKGSAIGETN